MELGGFQGKQLVKRFGRNEPTVANEFACQLAGHNQAVDERFGASRNGANFANGISAAGEKCGLFTGRDGRFPSDGTASRASGFAFGVNGFEGLRQASFVKRG